MEILIILFLILCNGVLAMSEIAVVSSRRARLEHLTDQGNAGAVVALELINAPNRFLSTVQIGITLVGVLAGAFGGATLAEQLATVIDTVAPALAPYSSAIGFGIVVGMTTYLSLVIGELAPKRLALKNPEKVAALIARPMKTLSTITAPVVYVLSKSTALALRLIGVRQIEDPPVTEMEIISMIRQGTDIGVFKESEQEMVESIFRLDDQRAEGLITPRTEIIWLDVTEPASETHRKIRENVHSTYPVCQGAIDSVIGIVHADDVLAQMLSEHPLDLKAIARRPHFIPENVAASAVLDRFKSSDTDVVLVVGEYGGVEGLVTLHDMLEAIVGEIDVEEAEAVRREDGTWLLDGLLPMHRLEELFPHLNLPDEKEREYETLGGFIMTRLGHVPRTSEGLTWGQLYFEVVDMDGNRIDKVLARPATPQDNETH